MAGKSILVVDTPSSCKSCKFYDEWWCKIEDHCPEDDIGESGRAIWCPLRPLPRRMPMRDEAEFYLGYMNGKTKYLGFNEGYNACLEDITGETE